MDAGSKFQEMERHWEDGIARCARFVAQRSAVERNHPELTGENESDHSAHAAGDVEERRESYINGPVGFFGNLT